MLKNTISMAVLVCVCGLVLGAAGTAGDEAKIAYPCEGIAPFSDTQLCISNPDGSGAYQVTNFFIDYEQSIGSISWAASGSEIFFMRWTQSQETIPGINEEGMYLFKINSDGTNLEVVNLERPINNSNSSHTVPIAWTNNVPSSVAAISPLGQLVIVFLLGAVTALYFSRQRGQTSGLVGS